MAVNFIKYAEEAHEYIKKMALQLGFTEERTLRAVRAVLHAIRDRIGVGESLNLISQFPFFLKGLYVERWKLSERVENFSTLDEFAERIMAGAGRTFVVDFESKEQAVGVSRAVMHSLRRYVSEGELANVYKNLPKELKAIYNPEINV